MMSLLHKGYFCEYFLDSGVWCAPLTHPQDYKYPSLNRLAWVHSGVPEGEEGTGCIDKADRLLRFSLELPDCVVHGNVGAWDPCVSSWDQEFFDPNDVAGSMVRLCRLNFGWPLSISTTGVPSKYLPKGVVRASSWET